MSRIEPPEIPVPPGSEDRADDPTAAAPVADVVAAPGAGIPVPPGAPPGYRGYGITAATPAAPVAPTVSAWQPPAAPPAAEGAADPGDASAPDAAPATGDDSDSVTLAAPEALEPDARAWALRLPDGRGLRIDRMLLLGRSPDAAHGPPGARPVPIDDPARTVSRSHLVVGPSGPGELLVRNVSTVNALVVTGADGTELKVEPGGSIVLVDDTRLLVGAYPIVLERL